MYDSDSDGRITLEEYRNVKYSLGPSPLVPAITGMDPCHNLPCPVTTPMHHMDTPLRAVTAMAHPFHHTVAPLYMTTPSRGLSLVATPHGAVTAVALPLHAPQGCHCCGHAQPCPTGLSLRTQATAGQGLYLCAPPRW